MYVHVQLHLLFLGNCGTHIPVFKLAAQTVRSATFGRWGLVKKDFFSTFSKLTNNKISCKYYNKLLIIAKNYNYVGILLFKIPIRLQKK